MPWCVSRGNPMKDVDSLLHTGERISNLERMLNIREGVTRELDTLPPSSLSERGEYASIWSVFSSEMGEKPPRIWSL